MNPIRTRLTAAALISVVGCGGTGSDPIEALVVPLTSDGCGNDLYAAGTVSRNVTPTTWNEPFVASSDAHIQIQLSTAFLDGPETVIVEQSLPFTSLPFPFEICGDESQVEMMRQGELFISVNIYNHAGYEPKVGDLLSEHFNSLDGPSHELSILVSGLEHCSAPNAGGFCTNNR